MPRPGDGSVRASIVVPTRGRPEPLRRCLEALAAQDAAFRYEVVVVDDSPAPSGVPCERPHERLVQSGGRGAAAARNLGVETSSGAFICLIDDDCLAPESWLQAMVTAAEGRPGTVIAGPTVNGHVTSALSAASQHIVSWLAETTADGGSEPPFAPTSNICCARETLEEIRFDPAFPQAAAEDRDWCARLAAAGHPLVWLPEAPVYHYAERGLAEYLRRHYRYGSGSRAYRVRHAGEARPHTAGAYLQLFKGGFTQGPRVGAAVALAQLATIAGYLSARRPQRERRADGE